MEITGQAVLLRIFIGESDKLGHLPLYEAIVKRARDAGLAGATVLKGVLGFGATARIRTTKILDLSSDLSMVIEIVDEADKVDAFKQTLSELFHQADCGGLVTLENIRVIHYVPSSHSSAGTNTD
jgi:PII-like signaling protein